MKSPSTGAIHHRKGRTWPASWLGFFTASLLFAASAWRANAGGGPQNTLMVVNARSATSLEVANEYQRLRRIPEENVVYLPATNTAVFYAGGDLLRMIPVATFRTHVLAPVLRHIRTRGLTNQIDLVVFSTDVPHKVDATAEAGPLTPSLPRCGLTTAMAFGELIEAPGSATNLLKQVMHSFRGYELDPGNPNTLTTNVTFQRSWHPTVPSRYRMSMMLGWTHAYGNTPEEIKAYLQNAVSADGTQPMGTVYIDHNPDLRSNLRKPQFPATVAELTALGVPTVVISNNPAPWSLVGKSNVIGAAMGAPSLVIPSGTTLLKGAIAEHLTSWACVLDNNDAGQTRATLWLTTGAAGTAGLVTEPMDPEDTPDKWLGVRMHAHYRRGVSLVEAFYQTVKIPYQMLMLGDPLCQPYARFPVVTVGGLLEGQLVSGVVGLTPGATTAAAVGIAGYDLFLDGVLWQAVAPGGGASLDTSALADGWHELRVVAYENSAIRTQGDRVVNFRVNNGGQQLLPGATTYAVVDGSGPLAIPVIPAGGTPTGIEIRKGHLVVATLPAEGGTASVPLELLGRGRSVLRAVAVMSSGLVRSEPMVVEVQTPPDVTPPSLPGFRAFTAANSIMISPSVKPAYKSGDFVYLALMPSEPIGVVSNLNIQVGSGRVAPFQFRWNGLSSTNPVPYVRGTTNDIIYRYTLSRSVDAEGPVPVVVSLRDAAGNAATVTNYFLADYTAPVVTNATVSPAMTNAGSVVAIVIAPNEPVSARPALYVNGAPAVFVSSNGPTHTFSYTVRAGDVGGPAVLLVSNLVDMALNKGSSTVTNSTVVEPPPPPPPPPTNSYYGDSFEGKVVGSNLTNDTRWTALLTSAGDLTAAAFIAGSPVAPGGSTRSAVFRDVAGAKNQIYWLAMSNAVTAAAVEFDVYLDDRNPAGAAVLEVRASSAKTNYREVGLILRQTAGANTWEVAVARATGTVVLTNGLPLRTWHRVRFDNDVGTNSYSVIFDGVTLAAQTVYAAPIQALTTVNNIQFRHTSNDEDVYLDNLTLPTSGGAPPPPPPPPPTNSVYGDDFESKTVGSNLTADPRWTVLSSSSFPLSSTAFVTDSAVPAGSTRAAAFRDQAGTTNQIYWFALTSSVPAVAVELDVYLDDRNPAGAAAMEIRASIDKTNYREIALLLRQTAGASTWELAVNTLAATPVYRTGLPLRTWHHVRFENDVVNNTYSVSLNGAVLASRVGYATPMQTVTAVNTIQFRHTSADEDVYIDNVTLPAVTTFAPVIVPAAMPGPFHLSAEQLDADSLTLTFATKAGGQYTLQFSADLLVWVDLESFLATDNSYTTTLPLNSDHSRYWRVVKLP